MTTVNSMKEIKAALSNVPAQVAPAKSVQTESVNAKNFATKLKALEKTGISYGDAIHAVAIYVLRQVNYGTNFSPVALFMDALTTRHDKARVQAWLIKFGKCTMKSGKLVYKNRKDLTEANMDANQDRAVITPYWELTAQPVAKVTFDYLAMLTSIVNKADKVTELEQEGKTVTQLNVGLLENIRKLVESSKPVVNV